MADESGFDPVPWFVGGGAEHTAEIARLLPYALSGGAEGVVGPTDLKVSALPVPAGRVQMAPGACLMRNRNVAGSQETYIARAPRTSYIDIPATGSSGGRTDLVGVTVADEQYEGFPDPPDAEAARFWQRAKPIRIPNVNPGIRSAKELNLSYPVYGAALVTLPPSTGTVTAGMLTPLRELALPREKNYLQSTALNSVLNAIDLETWKTWPAENYQVRIPEWATHVNTIIHLSGIIRQGGSIGAALRARFGDFLIAGDLIVEYDAGDGAASEARESFLLTCGGEVPVNRRGTLATLGSEGRRLFPQFYPGYLRAAGGGQIAWDIRFYERPI